MNFKVGDRVDSCVRGTPTDSQGTVVLVCSNYNVVVEADDGDGIYIYDENGLSIDMPHYSIKKSNAD